MIDLYFLNLLLNKLFGKVSEFIYEPEEGLGCKIILFCLPSFIFAFIIASISAFLFYKRRMKRKVNDYYYEYEFYLKRKDNPTFIILLVINSLFAIILTLINIPLSIALVLFIILISIPLKFIPLKIIAGLLIGLIA